ncbi:MAG: glycoside hydrolase family 5 protein [Chloroflexi bacterium]|jgi:hypothetical protein|nr:glycoside hydrolase family 5 protein [Chloroflexota bacterium]
MAHLLRWLAVVIVAVCTMRAGVNSLERTDPTPAMVPTDSLVSASDSGCAECPIVQLPMLYAGIKREGRPSESHPSDGRYEAHLPLVYAQVESRYMVAIPLLLKGGTAPLIVGEPPAPVTSSASPEPETVGEPEMVADVFIRAEGDKLMLQGKPFYFLGVNSSQLLQPYFPDCEIEPQIKYLAETKGVNVVRIWFFPGHDMERLERVLDLGKKYGIYYIVTLQNYHYYKTQGWFAHRYITEDLPHVRETVTRFRDRPEILMWELMNEPSCGPENGSQECTDYMYKWAKAVSTEIKTLDPNHLISVGTTLGGWTMHEQENYERMHALETVDVVSIHRRVGKTSKAEMRVAEKLNKPVFVGEAYYMAYNDDCWPINGEVLGERARYIAKDLEWSFAHGMDGYLLWEHTSGEIVTTGGDSQWICDAYVYMENDPTYQVFQEYLHKFLSGQVVDSQKVGHDDD